MPHKHAIMLLTAIVIAVLAGGISGWVWGETMVSVKWLGDLFLDALKMTIVPLIIAAVISGVTAMGDVRKLERVGLYTVGYYALTTAIAVLIGLLMVNLIQPGVGLGALSETVPEGLEDKHAGVSDILRSLISPNLIASASQM